MAHAPTHVTIELSDELRAHIEKYVDARIADAFVTLDSAISRLRNFAVGPRPDLREIADELDALRRGESVELDEFRARTIDGGVQRGE